MLWRRPLWGMFYGAQLQAMLPKLHSRNFPGMELIRPMYCIHEEDICAWRDFNDLHFIACACRLTEERDKSGDGIGNSKRAEIKQLLKTLRETNPDVEKNVFSAIHAVSLDTMPGWKIGERNTVSWMTMTIGKQRTVRRISKRMRVKGSTFP